MENRIKRIAQIGYASKGVVYTITGILTFMAAFQLGGEKAGKGQVLQFLKEQQFGSMLVILMAVGIFSYALWRFIQTFSDPENIGNDLKGKAKRFGKFVSGLLYLALAYAAVMKIIGSGNSGSEDATKKPFFATETGLIIIGIAGLILIGLAIHQFIKVYKGNYLKKFDWSSLHNEGSRKSIEFSANFGLTARGVIFLISGYFAIKAALNANPDEIKTTREVFSFIEDSTYGGWLLGIVAAGLVAYAIHMFLIVKYRKFGA